MYGFTETLRRDSTQENFKEGTELDVNGKKSWARREVESGWLAGQQAELVSWEL